MKQFISLINSFLLGLILILSLSILLSNNLKFNPNLNSNYFLLAFSGGLGALIYCFVLDGRIELPTLIDNTFKPGFIGDIVIGISGGFIVYISLEGTIILNTSQNNSSLLIFLIGLIGGYGSKAIIDAALSKIIRKIYSHELIEEENKRLKQEVNNLQRELEEIKQVDHRLHLAEEVKQAEDKVLNELTDEDGNININENINPRVLWTVYNRQIKLYQDETRERAKLSFLYAITSMIIGLIVVIIGAVIILVNKNSTQNTIAGASISTLGGVLSGYITKTFMDVHRLSISQLNKYFEQPVKKDHILTIRDIIKEIKTVEDREEAYLKVIESIMNLIDKKDNQLKK